MEAGEPPAFITDWPDVGTQWRHIWEAWHRLSPSRSVGLGGVGGIPFEAIDRYVYRYPVDDFDGFHRLLMAMDAAYMEHIREKQERDG